MGTLTDLRNSFRQAREQIRPMTQDDLVRAATEVQKQMQLHAPVRTGFLRDHIQVIASPGRVTVGPVGVPYAAAQEYGARPHAITAKPGKTLAFRMNGKMVFVKSVKHPGNRPQPYIRPAREWAEVELSKKIALSGASFFKDRP